MTFWDASFTTSSPGTSTPPPQTVGNHPPTLNEEVTEVIGQLGRFWGGFRKQSQSTIEAARKDLGEYVSQAQQGLNKQLATLSTPSASNAEAPSPVASSSRDLNDSTTTDGESSGSSSTSASTATLADPKRQQEEGRQREQEQQEAQSPTQAQTLFTRLQSSLPPDLLTSIRDTIPDSVRHLQARKDLAQAAQVRGEELLRGASGFLRDAVRVLPPNQAAPSSASAFAFASVVPPHAHDGPARTRRKVPPSPVAVASATAGTRRGALLYALRANPAILRVDPAKEDRSAAQFMAWVEAGTDAIHDESRRESELAANDGLLGNTRSALVPEELSEDEFWTRYFFRMHQVDQEDERRKAVLSAGPPDQDDDFSWEDEDEDGSQKVQLSPQLAAPVLNRDKLLDATTASGTTSPERSDDSFDIVSSGNVSAAGDVGATRVDRRESSDGNDDGGEEDREEDDDDDEEEEEEEEEDESDWE